MSGGGCGARGLLCLGRLAEAKGVQGRAQRRRQRPVHTPSLHFGSVGSEISCYWESPSLGTAGCPPPPPPDPTAPSRRRAFSVLNKNEVGNFPQ